MCIVLSPASFLAVAFRESKKEDLDYSWLNDYCKSIQCMELANGPVDVSWDHDSVNYTMGYFSPVFSSNENGVHCNLEVLDLYYEDITQEMSRGVLKSVEDCAKSFSKSKE